MLMIPENKTIYVYTQPVDMRKAVNGLVILLLESFDQNPQTGDLFLFTNKHRNKIKCLFWDRNGFALYYKRLEKGRFNYSKQLHDDKVVVTQEQLRALLMGLDFYLLGKYPAQEYESFF